MYGSFFEAMSLVLAVAEAGSLSAAPRHQKAPLPTVSRRCRAPSAHLRRTIFCRRRYSSASCTRPGSCQSNYAQTDQCPLRVLAVWKGSGGSHGRVAISAKWRCAVIFPGLAAVSVWKCSW